MGYETALHLIGVKIKAESIRAVSRALKTRKARRLSTVGHFLEVAAIDSEGFLVFNTSENWVSPYAPDEDDGTVPALSGKWGYAEAIARWLSKHSEKDGRIVLHSEEGDGAAWGWEFDGKGRMRPLGLVPVGKWE